MNLPTPHNPVNSQPAQKHVTPPLTDQQAMQAVKDGREKAAK